MIIKPKWEKLSDASGALFINRLQDLHNDIRTINRAP